MSTTLTESTVRRRAAAAGYRLIKSRVRRIDAWEHGTFGLVDAESGFLALPPVADSAFGYTLAEVAEALDQRAS